ncbi:MAG TPA: helix-turn-helix domain-containing protein [bacterium]|jgi:excisionase family DNA binding protein|nr:MAG: Helix-turn-helix domain protein [Parcubacteria group bacterium ADurb.Bin115]HNU81300.1 helix-turn-helix domain-containing protein [bacterium]HPW05771.1 helix-turn-helix domain-containing protein [bacterium]HQB76446.1 helix-turn-helix domain-containing protein [bacterium]
MKAEKNYYTVKELADIMGLSRITIFKRIKAGKIKAEKIGRNYIIYKNDLKEMFSNNLTKDDKIIIKNALKIVLNEYGDTIRMLGKE